MPLLQLTFRRINGKTLHQFLVDFQKAYAATPEEKKSELSIRYRGIVSRIFSEIMQGSSRTQFSSDMSPRA
jgi:hypothetical protein